MVTKRTVLFLFGGNCAVALSNTVTLLGACPAHVRIVKGFEPALPDRYKGRPQECGFRLGDPRVSPSRSPITVVANTSNMLTKHRRSIDLAGFS
jgi:hypothetical protein